MGKKVFRHSPHRGADAIKILAGTKTNATIRDLEETIEDIEEKEGVVVSIDKDKIAGEGWSVKDEDGKVYKCNIASNMYQLPETEEYGGMYYPTDKVKVKMTINPVLRTNTITEITSLGEEEEQVIDLSEWKHEDKATTIIASPKSAISISGALISFNYNNANEVTANEEEVKANGKKTNVSTDKLEINSKDIKIQDQSLEEFTQHQVTDALLEMAAKYEGDGINVVSQNNLGQINLNVKSVYIPADQRVIMDLKDPSLYPEQEQRHPLLAGNSIDELYIYPNGLVAVRSRDVPNEKDIFSTHNWATTPYRYKNLITVSINQTCDCCNDISSTQTFFNYCPHCETWTTLYNKQNRITCSSCSREWCQSCGHLVSNDCGNTTFDLKKYNAWRISAVGLPCSYCKDDISYGKTREYANYCPKCHNWGYLTTTTEYENGEERRFLHCDYCKESYCVNCSISQGQGFIKSFLNDRVNNQNDYIGLSDFQNFKIKHIRDD